MIAVGTDILEIARIEAVVERLGDRFVARILTAEEQREYNNSQMPLRLLAKRFAAKEAIAKALGTGIGRGVSWQHMNIVHDDKGAPMVELSGGALAAAEARGGSRVLLSLADEQAYVVAFAVLGE
ncbi:holo-ACP synthase [Parahaliea sp. F7430]|uniref:Holo-[acyl-carrier-protein] synthase n=1 Tax=Sediminihaliea albiluteola TaxID=2758564 RepID=A0A7W2YJP7_9GAMM|nr:holo-ACP synthase [Sediminihaliea albiluteola]MBA6412533.1 holo-ACP synthase [Sediminihaliea albiluteola]